LDPPVFKNLVSFIAHRVIRNWQKLSRNNFLVFKNLAKTDLFGSHLIFKPQIFKNWKKKIWKDPNMAYTYELLHLSFRYIYFDALENTVAHKSY
jgi:hypothetical protein